MSITRSSAIGHNNSHRKSASISSKKGEEVIPSWKQLNKTVGDGQLYPYLLRLTVLAYRCQPRFRSSYEEKGHRRGSSVDMLTPQSSNTSLSLSPTANAQPPPSFSSKLPKEVPKLLQKRFKEMALSSGTKDDDALLRRSYLSFYALILSPDFVKQAKENRRAEDLVMRFLSCVAKELNKAAIPPQEAKVLVDKHAAAFVRLLINTIKDGGLSSHGQSLIKQLESYESSLKNSSQLNTVPNKRHAHSSSVGEGVAKPTFQVDDMTLAQDVGKLMVLGTSVLQQDVNNAKASATEQRAVAELRNIEQNLHTYDQHVVYQKIDFANNFEWQEWKERELELIEQQISQYGQSNSPEESYFLPPDVKAYYRHLLKRCLERDSANAGQELESNPDSITVLVSKSSSELLNEAAHLWRVPSVTRAVLLLDVAQEMFKDGVFDLDNLNDAFNLARHVASLDDKRKKEWAPSSWPQSDKVHFVTSLQSIHDTIMDRLCECLEKIYENSPPKLGPLLQVLDGFVFVDANTKGFATVEPTQQQMDKLEKTIVAAAEMKYDALIDDIPRDHTLDPLHIIDLADKLIGIAKRLQKRYKFALFDQISIGHVSAQRHFTLFAADSKSMFEHMMSHLQTRNEEPSFEDMVVLYKKLAEIRDLYVQVSKEPFPFDIERSFYPYVVKWAESSAGLAQSWVDPAIESDKFLPTNEEADQLHSSSVTDVFASFRSAINVVAELDWRNDFHRAKIMTVLMKGISGASCQYSNKLFQLFWTELRTKEDDEKNHVRTRQDKWIALAKSAVNGKTMKIPPPYQFLKETCVKLNNVELAQVEMDKIENEMDSEKLSRVIAQKESSKKRANSYLFTVKVVQAEGLKACDMNGLSDPYVTLADQQSRKSIGKTRTIYEDLNPYWDETFELATSETKWLTATVWDENALSNHDLCGRAFIRLDPNAFQDFVSQEYWLDLDTQGKLLVSISVESERDDIRFHFGKAFRTMARTEADMIRMIVDKFTAFIKYSISVNTLKSLQGIGRFNVNMDAVSNWLGSTRISKSGQPHRLTQTEIEDSLNPLFDYLNENFATLAEGLTKEMRLKVMTQTWKVVLHTIESLLLPTLSSKRTTQQQLSAAEADIVFTWLSAMRDFFHHDGAGPSLEVLQSQKYQELMTIPVYYDLTTAELKQESEKLSSLSFKSLQERTYFVIPEMIKRKNTVMAHRNKRALKKQNEQIRNAKRESPQTEDIILRILRARGEVEYLTRRLKQRERISQTLATESIVRKAAAGGGFKREDF